MFWSEGLLSSSVPPHVLFVSNFNFGEKIFKKSLQRETRKISNHLKSPSLGLRVFYMLVDLAHIFGDTVGLASLMK